MSARPLVVVPSGNMSICQREREKEEEKEEGGGVERAERKVIKKERAKERKEKERKA